MSVDSNSEGICLAPGCRRVGNKAIITAKYVNGYFENDSRYDYHLSYFDILAGSYFNDGHAEGRADVSWLEEAYIGWGTEEIGDCAFYNCRSLKHVEIEDGVRSIGESAFEGCVSLVSVKIPDSVTWIPLGIFKGCSRLTSIRLPSGLTSVELSAFAGCSSLVSVELPSNVKHIGWQAFYGCSSLSSINLPAGLTSIGWHAFCGCRMLTSVVLSESVVDIDKEAFEGCPNLTIHAPAGSYAWKYARENNIPVVLVDETEKECIQPEEKPAEVAASVAVSGKGFRDGFRREGNKAIITAYGFWGAQNGNHCGVFSRNYFDELAGCLDDERTDVSWLEEAYIGPGTEKIGYLAFYGCENLKRVVIAEGVTSIGEHAFAGCSSLTSIVLPESLISIGHDAFRGCSSLASIAIPKSVTSIGNNAFEDCSSLASIAIPKNVKSVGKGAFKGCSSLASIVIPKGVTSIDHSAFSGCSSLTSIVLPESLISIGHDAFRGCSSLASIAIPKSVTSIGNNAFEDCSSLASIAIPKNVKSVGKGAFKGCSSLASIVIPKGVTSIDHSAFSGCPNLTIHAPAGSYAWKYARENNIPVVLVDETEKECIQPEEKPAEVAAGENDHGQCNVSGWKLFKTQKETEEKRKTEEARKEAERRKAEEERKAAEILRRVRVAVLEKAYLEAELATLKGLFTRKRRKQIEARLAEIEKDLKGEQTMSVDSNSESICLAPGCWRVGNTTIITAKYVNGYFENDSRYDYHLSYFDILAGSYFNDGHAEGRADVSWLEEAYIGWGTEEIGDCAFYNCRSLKHVEIEDGVRSIGESAFEGCVSLVSVKIPDSVTRIPAGIFNGCSRLTSIRLPSGLTSVELSAFAGCSSLVSVELPSNVKHIGWQAFYGCSSLSSINLPAGLTSIGWHAFCGCRMLTSVVLSESVVDIDKEAFEDCSNLIIHAPTGSYAWKYALENGIRFVPIEKSVSPVTDPENTVSEKRICSACQKELEADMRFCPYCGKENDFSRDVCYEFTVQQQTRVQELMQEIMKPVQPEAEHENYYFVCRANEKCAVWRFTVQKFSGHDESWSEDVEITAKPVCCEAQKSGYLPGYTKDSKVKYRYLHGYDRFEEQAKELFWQIAQNSEECWSRECKPYWGKMEGVIGTYDYYYWVDRFLLAKNPYGIGTDVLFRFVMGDDH